MVGAVIQRQKPGNRRIGSDGGDDGAVSVAFIHANDVSSCSELFGWAVDYIQNLSTRSNDGFYGPFF